MLNTNNKFTQPVFQFNLFNMCNVFLDNIYIYIYIYWTFITLVFIFVHSCRIAMQQQESLYHSKKNKLTSILQSLFCIYSTHAPKQRTQTIHTVSVSIIVISCTMTMTVKLFELLFLSWGTIKSLSILINGLRVKSLFCIYFS